MLGSHRAMEFAPTAPDALMTPSGPRGHVILTFGVIVQTTAIPIESLILGALGHPRYRGQYLPVWRIIEATGLPLEAPRVRGALQRLEYAGRVEHRRAEWRHADPRTLEWRAAARFASPSAR
jgi:hypothetical protein